MTKEQIIEQLETSLNEYKGLNEAIDDAAFYIAAEFDKLKDYSVAKKENSIEAKQRAANYMSLKGALEPKQETLEEASQKFAYNYFEMNEINHYKALKQGFVAGAKWQQERMYSEEDLREAFKQSRQALIFEKDMPPVYENFEEWFEQFKKK